MRGRFHCRGGEDAEVAILRAHFFRINSQTESQPQIHNVQLSFICLNWDNEITLIRVFSGAISLCPNEQHGEELV
jgi:hypothetical protein